METRLRLPALTIGVDKETTISNDVCKNKTGYIDMCRSSLMPQDFFFNALKSLNTAVKVVTNVQGMAKQSNVHMHNGS